MAIAATYKLRDFLADANVLLEYNWSDEAADYEEHAQEDPDIDEHHIFARMKRMAEFMEGCRI